MLNIVLFEPEIPPNTGNIIRLCANSGASLHLIEPLGFSLDTKALRRAGLDYHEAAKVRCWPSLETCWEALGAKSAALQAARDRVAIPQDMSIDAPLPRTWAATTRGNAMHTEPDYRQGDILLFGPESRGLPAAVLDDTRVTSWIRIPMCAGSRSLNLSNAVSIVLYEAWRQLDFAGSVTQDQ